MTRRGRAYTDPLATSPASRSQEKTTVSLAEKCSQLQAGLVHIHELKEYLPLLLRNFGKDPIECLRSLFSLGLPLCILWNLLADQPQIDLSALQTLPPRIATRRAMSAFLVKVQTLKRQLGDLSYSDILEMNDSVLDRLADFMAHIVQQQPGSSTSNANHNLAEYIGSAESDWDEAIQTLLRAEHHFVQDLKAIRAYARSLSENHLMAADTLEHIFPSSLFIFHRKFLVMLESTAQLSRSDQRWSEHFLKKKEDFGVVYNLHVVNSALVEPDLHLADAKLRDLGIKETSGLGLGTMLATPLQHLGGYCLHIETLKTISISCSSLRPQYNELATALNMMQSLHRRMQDARKSVKLDQVTSDLRSRIKDWGHHEIEEFGRLLMHSLFHMTVGHNDVEHSVFLFEKTLLYCTEVPDSPQSGRLRMGSFSFRPRALSDSDSRKNTKMCFQIQGCVRIQEIEDVLAVTSHSSHDRNQQWKLLVACKGKTLRFICQTPDQLKEWETELRILTHSGSSTRRIALRLSSFPLPSTVKVKFRLNGELFATIVPRGISYDALCHALVHKWAVVASRHSGSAVMPNIAALPPITLKYNDENNLMVSIVSTRDVDAAFGATDTISLIATFID